MQEMIELPQITDSKEILSIFTNINYVLELR